jgi:hypothetical protein
VYIATRSPSRAKARSFPSGSDQTPSNWITGVSATWTRSPLARRLAGA